MVALSVINQPTSAATKLNIIVKIHKYERFHEGHHFILMAIKVHNIPKHDMDRFIKECLVFSTIDDWEIFILVFLHLIFQATC
jgi:hypothetical protein